MALYHKLKVSNAFRRLLKTRKQGSGAAGKPTPQHPLRLVVRDLLAQIDTNASAGSLDARHTAAQSFTEMLEMVLNSNAYH